MDNCKFNSIMAYLAANSPPDPSTGFQNLLLLYCFMGINSTHLVAENTIAVGEGSIKNVKNPVSR